MLRKLLFEIQGLDHNLTKLEQDAEAGGLSPVCRLFHSVAGRTRQTRGPETLTNEPTVMAAEEEVAEGWKVYYQNRTEGSRELTLRIAAIKEIVLRRLAGALHATEILASGDVDETMRGAFEMLQLYQWLEEPTVGIRTVASLMQKYAARSLDLITGSPSTLDFRFAVKTGKVGDFVRGLASWCRTEVARAGLRPDLLHDATQIIPERILHEGQAALLTLVRTFSHERNLYPTVQARVPQAYRRKLTLFIQSG